jgi:hypothetical protein
MRVVMQVLLTCCTQLSCVTMKLYPGTLGSVIQDVEPGRWGLTTAKRS